MPTTPSLAASAQPAPPTQTRLSATDRREQIRRIAGPIFARGGYSATRLDDVARAAGVTKPIVYRHFGSKKGLYMALLEKHRADLPTFFATAQSDPATQIRAILADWLDYVAANGHNWVLLFRDSSGDEEIRAMRERVNREARAAMATYLATVAGPDLPTEQIEPTAEFLTSGLAGLALWATDHPEVPRETLLDTAFRLSLAAAYRSPAARSR